jgi:hypothetical protein
MIRTIFRTIFQWLISRNVDDGKQPGIILSWIIRHDKDLRFYYNDLLRLETQLQHDASALLEFSAKTRWEKPLRIVNRSILFSDHKSFLRARSRKILTTLGLSMLFVFGTGSFFISVGNGNKVVVAGQISELRTIAVSVENDPQIYTELLQLCRQTPNESSPFFVNPKE